MHEFQLQYSGSVMEDAALNPIANPEDGVRRIIDDEMWEVLSAAIERVCDRRGRKPELDVREFCEAVFYWGRTGIQWRDMPKCFGKWDAVYNRWRRWEQNGYWKDIWIELQSTAPESASELFVDSTVIPSRSNRKESKAYDKAKYKLRNQAERLINRLKRLRRLATRYEKLACTFLAVVHIGCILSILA